MATKVCVPVTRIGCVREHPNASMLGLAQVLGFQVVVGLVENPDGTIIRKFVKDQVDDRGKRIPVIEEKDGYYVEDKMGVKTFVGSEDAIVTIKYSFQYKEGDLVVYFPGDTIIPDDLAVSLGVKTLLRSGNRVAKIALRGEPSFGLVVKLPADVDWNEDDNVAEYYGAIKYEPPIKTSAGDAAKYDSEIDPWFDKFTDIENGRMHTNVFKIGERVVMSEKLHGSSCRVACINGHDVAGSMELRRKKPEDGDFSKNTYWYPWSIDGVNRLVKDMSQHHKVVELFGEVYGNSIQKGFKYDAGNGIGFRAFGLKIQGTFLDWDVFMAKCREYDIPTVPVLYDGPFDFDKIVAIIEGDSTIGDAPVMEGGVVVSVPERTDPRVGRAVLKYISYRYDLLKNKPDCKDI